ncbi:MAG: beta-propeller domain-containing protein [Oscillospiraceae bacterium]|nr:beta-propeller domain-containing protein [Oscillospiraceae bacterium]
MKNTDKKTIKYIKTAIEKDPAAELPAGLSAENIEKHVEKGVLAKKTTAPVTLLNPKRKNHRAFMRVAAIAAVFAVVIGSLSLSGVFNIENNAFIPFDTKPAENENINETVLNIGDIENTGTTFPADVGTENNPAPYAAGGGHIKSPGSYEEIETLFLNKYNAEKQRADNWNAYYYSSGDKDATMPETMAAAMPEEKMDAGGMLAGIDESDMLEYGRADTGLGGDEYGRTNLQVDNVDEGDIIKNDGRYLYALSRDMYDYHYRGREGEVYNSSPDCRVAIVDTSGTGMSAVSKINVSADAERELAPSVPEGGMATVWISPEEMYVSGNILTVVGGYGHETYDKNGNWDGKSFTVACFYDISDRANPKFLKIFTQDGSCLSSRVTNGKLILMSSYYVNLYAPNLRGACVPEIAGAKIAVDDILMIKGDKAADNGYLVISGVNLADLDQKPDGKAILGGGSNAYCTSDSLYIANVVYNVNVKFDEENKNVVTETMPEMTTEAVKEPRGYDEAETVEVFSEPSAAPADEITTALYTEADMEDNAAGLVVDSIIPPSMWWRNYSTATEIFAFSIKGGIESKGYGIVPGEPLNQFSMDEHKGFFRIATTEYTYGGTTNSVFVLDGEFRVTGAVTGLGKNETIQSVRFMGDAGYVVTFMRTDPLYVLDLSDPYNPKTDGELKIPGFSQYLHPIGDGYMLGFGVSGDENGQTDGVKISLFDVKDPKKPREADKLEINHARITDTSHKAVMSVPSKGLYGFPVSLIHSTNYNYYESLFLQTFTADTEKEKLGFSYKYAPDDVYNYNYNLRGTYIGDTVYVVTNNAIAAYNMNDGEKTGSLDLVS